MSAAHAAQMLDSYAMLLGKKLLIPSQKTKYVAEETEFLVDVLRSRVGRIHVDDDWYLGCNPDVRSAVENGLVKDAREHYMSSGFYEHRLPYEINVDEAWYFDQYHDIRAAVDDALFPSGQVHFETVGYREGRLPFAGFRLAEIRDQPDRLR